MTTTYDWPTERERATTLFNGDTPGAAIETAILSHFKREPGKVATLITAIGRRVANGKVHSGWAVLRSELDHVAPQVTATDNHERSLQLRIAEDWIRNTGGYLDRQEELESELFDEHIGALRHWPDLKPAIVALWLEQRHRFQKAEQAAEERARRYIRIRTAIGNATHTHDINLDQHATNIAAEVARANANIDFEAA